MISQGGRSRTLETAFRLGSGAGFLAWKSATALIYVAVTYLMLASGLLTGSIDDTTTYSSINLDFQQYYHGNLSFLHVNSYKRHDPMRNNLTTVTTPTTPTTSTTSFTNNRREAFDDLPTPTIDHNHDSHNQQRTHATTTGDPPNPTDIAEIIRHLSTVKEELPTKSTPACDPSNPRLISDAMTDTTKRAGDPPKGRRQCITASELLHYLAQLGFIVL